MINAAIPSHVNESAYWKSYYLRSVDRQLSRMINLVAEHKQSPDVLKLHFESMVAVFEQGITYSESGTQQKLLQFVRTFHPLPVWWGKWSEWMRVLDKAAGIAQQMKDNELLAWLYLSKANMLLSTGSAEQALAFSKLAARLTNEKYPLLYYRAELVTFKVDSFLGNLNDRLAAVEEIESSLELKKHLLPKEERQCLHVELLLQKADIQRRQGSPDQAIDLANRSLCMAKRYAPQVELLLAEAYCQSSYAHWTREEMSESIQKLKSAIAIYDGLGHRMAQIDCQGDMGLIYWSALRYDEAERTLQKGIHLAEENKALWWQAVQTGNLGLVNFTRGKLSQAMALMEQHYVLSNLTNNKAEEERASGNIGLVQIFRGNFQDAYERLQHNLEYAEKAKLFIAQGVILANLAWALEGLGLLTDAEQCALEALKISEKMDSVQLRIIALRSLGELQNDSDKKARYVEEAYILAHERSRRLNEAGTLLTLSACTNDERYYQNAVKILRALGSKAWMDVPLAFKTRRLPLLLWG